MSKKQKNKECSKSKATRKGCKMHKKNLKKVQGGAKMSGMNPAIGDLTDSSK